MRGEKAKMTSFVIISVCQTNLALRVVEIEGKYSGGPEGVCVYKRCV